MDTLVLHLSSADFLYCLRLAKNILRGLQNSIPKFFKKNSSLPFIGLQKARKNDWRFGNFCCKLTSNLTLTGLYAGGAWQMNLLWVYQTDNLGKPNQKVFYFFVRFPSTDILQYAALLKQEKSVIKRDRKEYCNITIWMMQSPIMHTIWCILPYVDSVYVHIIWCICYGLLLMISEMTPFLLIKYCYMT